MDTSHSQSDRLLVEYDSSGSVTTVITSRPNSVSFEQTGFSGDCKIQPDGFISGPGCHVTSKVINSETQQKTNLCDEEGNCPAFADNPVTGERNQAELLGHIDSLPPGDLTGINLNVQTEGVKENIRAEVLRQIDDKTGGLTGGRDRFPTGSLGKIDVNRRIGNLGKINKTGDNGTAKDYTGGSKWGGRHKVKPKPYVLDKNLPIKDATVSKYKVQTQGVQQNNFRLKYQRWGRSAGSSGPVVKSRSTGTKGKIQGLDFIVSTGSRKSANLSHRNANSSNLTSSSLRFATTSSSMSNFCRNLLLNMKSRNLSML